MYKYNVLVRWLVDVAHTDDTPADIHIFFSRMRIVLLSPCGRRPNEM